MNLHIFSWFQIGCFSYRFQIGVFIINWIIIGGTVSNSCRNVWKFQGFLPRLTLQVYRNVVVTGASCCNGELQYYQNIEVWVIWEEQWEKIGYFINNRLSYLMEKQQGLLFLAGYRIKAGIFIILLFSENCKWFK